MALTDDRIRFIEVATHLLNRDGKSLPMTTPLLTTKLYLPPPRTGMVPRPRLIERLNAGSHGKLTLISAPAGFGKTTLLSEWLHLKGEIHPSRVAWASLDESDNDPARFLAYFVAALQTIEAGIGETALAVLQSPQPQPIESLLMALINEIADTTDDPSTGSLARPGRVGRGFTLVLDDYHLITAQPIHTALTFLLDHLPPQMHLVISFLGDLL